MVNVHIDTDQYEAMLYIEYDADENSFYDECEIHIVNIFDIITPNDLLLFRKFPQTYSYFTTRNDSKIICKLIMNGVSTNYEKNCIIPCNFSSRGGCWFSDSEKNAREEICSACRGGDY